MDKDLEIILNKLPYAVKDFCVKNNNVTEIRVRKNSETVIVSAGINYLLEGTFTTEKEIYDLFLSLCDNTISAYEEQIAEGFITLAGGHRVGIAGRYSIDTDGNRVLNEVYSLNIRLSVFHKINIDKRYIDFNKGLLICGKPHSGKTNFLRNICYLLNGTNYAVCDERNEIYHSSLKGDFIINIPKPQAIMQAVRVLNPQVLICDEIGSKAEAEKMLEYLYTGVRFICSVHCDNYNDLLFKTNIKLLLDSGIFDKFILLENINNKFEIKEVIND